MRKKLFMRNQKKNPADSLPSTSSSYDETVTSVIPRAQVMEYLFTHRRQQQQRGGGGGGGGQDRGQGPEKKEEPAVDDRDSTNVPGAISFNFHAVIFHEEV
jgi:hypothetical protein